MKRDAEVSSILVYSGLDLIGDGVMKLPFLRALRQAYPAARITWLAGIGRSVYAGPLAELVAPYLDEVIEAAGIGRVWRESCGGPWAAGGSTWSSTRSAGSRPP